MADLDLLTLAEATNAINEKPAVGSTAEAELLAIVTAASLKIDELCGPVVLRSVTEVHEGGRGVIFLRQAPVSKTSATTVTSVKEFASGTATVLAAETLTTSADYLFDRSLGILERRTSWGSSRFPARSRVEVVYEAGRYPDTASVDQLFKRACVVLVGHLWGNRGAGSFATVDPNGAQTAYVGMPAWAVPRAVSELLSHELRPPQVA